MAFRIYKSYAFVLWRAGVGGRRRIGGWLKRFLETTTTQEINNHVR
jgi:hypothetical protein